MRSATPWLVFVVALAVRLLPLLLPFDFAGPDSATYLAPARALVEHGAYLDAAGEPDATRPPGYPVFLALCFTLGGEGVVRLAQALLGALSAVLVWAILARTTQPRTAAIGGALAALDPIAAGQAPFLLREVLLLTLLTGVLAALILLRGRLRALVAGLLLAGLAVTHQLYAILGGFLFAADLAAQGRRLAGRRLLPWIAMGLLVILPVFLWARRTERVVGHFSLSATPNAVPARELWLTAACDNPWLSGDPTTGFQALAFAEERRLVDRVGVPAAKAIYYRRAARLWRTDPLGTAGRVLRVNLWYWLDVPGAVRLAYHPRLRWARPPLVAFHWARLACALVGVWVLLRSGAWRAQRFVLAAVAFLALAPALLYPVPRYLGPAAPALSILAAIGLAAAWPRAERAA